MCQQSNARIYKNFVRCKFTFQRLIFRLIYICFLYKLSVYHIVIDSLITSFYIFEISNLQFVVSRNTTKSVKMHEKNRIIVEKENEKRISFLLYRVKKKALFFPSCEKRNWKKSLFSHRKCVIFFFFINAKSLFFFYVKRKIEKNFLSFFM